MDDIRDDIREIRRDLADHIRRTAMLEQRQDAFGEMMEKMAAKVEPLEKHIVMWAGANKVLIILGSLLGLAAAVRSFLH